MIIKINGVTLKQPEIIQTPVVSINETAEKLQNVGKTLLPISLGAGFMSITKGTLAATTATAVPTTAGASLATAIMPLIHMIQDFAFPAAIAVASWGLIEIMIGQPSGKEKLKHSILGFIGIYIIPMIFSVIKSSFGAI